MNANRKPRVPVKIRDTFLILPVTLPSAPSLTSTKPFRPNIHTATAPKETQIHYLYISCHKPRISTVTTPRSLFLANAPIDASLGVLRNLFSSIGGGRVESVIFSSQLALTADADIIYDSRKRKRFDNHYNTDDSDAEGVDEDEEVEDEGEVDVLKSFHKKKMLSTGSTAVITFVDIQSATATLKAVKESRKKSEAVMWPSSTNSNSGGVGGIDCGVTRIPTLSPFSRPDSRIKLTIKGYQSLHDARFPAVKDLQNSVDTFITNFFAPSANASSAQHDRWRRVTAETDEDGFTKVVGGKSSEEVKAEILKKAKERGGEKELKGFYRFQLREERKSRQKELLERFEIDRKRVEQRREERKLRPE
jgi:ribosomal RNA-processing protein 7